jgi:hypothetical protein
MITLPALPIRKTRIGGNLIVQHVFMGATCKAQIFDSEVKCHDLIRAQLTGPYRELLLRQKGTHRRPNGAPVMTRAEDGEPPGWPEGITLAWDRLGELETYCDTPDKVLRSWANQLPFAAAVRRFTDTKAHGIAELRPTSAKRSTYRSRSNNRYLHESPHYVRLHF